MIKSNWKVIAASVAGTSHKVKNIVCQDSFAWQVVDKKSGILIVVASDGAGSAKQGAAGAQTTCQTMMQEIRAVAERENDINKIARADAFRWLKLLQTQLEILARSEKLQVNDFAATLLVAIIADQTAIFVQIGDGGMVFAEGRDPTEFRLAIEPQQGEYANTTNFVTDRNAADSLKFEKLIGRFDEIAVFTDGLQRIALDYQSKSAHAPFFRPMFAPLRSDKIAANLTDKLRDFLDSPKINERTDDDKTLILAARR